MFTSSRHLCQPSSCLGPVQLERCTSIMYGCGDVQFWMKELVITPMQVPKMLYKMILSVPISLGGIMASSNTETVETPPSDLICKRNNPRSVPKSSESGRIPRYCHREPCGRPLAPGNGHDLAGGKHPRSIGPSYSSSQMMSRNGGAHDVERGQYPLYSNPAVRGGA